MKNSFVRLVTLILLLHAGCGSKPTASSNSKPTAAVADEPTAKDDHRRQFESFSLVVPDDWYSEDSGRKETKALLIAGSRLFFKKGLIMVDVGKPTRPTAMELAEMKASEFKGSVLEEPIELDGEPAVLMRTEAASMIEPRMMLITTRKERVYILSSAGKNLPELDKAFTKVYESWKWTD